VALQDITCAWTDAWTSIWHSKPSLVCVDKNVKKKKNKNIRRYNTYTLVGIDDVYLVFFSEKQKYQFPPQPSFQVESTVNRMQITQMPISSQFHQKRQYHDQSKTTKQTRSGEATRRSPTRQTNNNNDDTSGANHHHSSTTCCTTSTCFQDQVGFWVDSGRLRFNERQTN
jgi:hypothetical protein